jgi:type IV pilus assembly protein PilC
MEFSYIARDAAGVLQKGTVEADDKAGAAQALTAKGLTPVKLTSSGKGLHMEISLRPGVPLLEKVVFARQLATMVGAGLPLASSLHLLSEQTKNKKMSGVIGQLAADVEGGISFAAALEKHPKIFNRVMVSMVKAGETGGVLDQVLERVATTLEREHSVIGKIRGALIYPAVIVMALVIMFVLMMTMVVPKMTGIFEEIGTDLPLPTKILILISDLFTRYAIFTAIALVILVVAWLRFIRTARGRRFWHGLLLHLPVAGKMSAKLNLARFTQTLGALMAAGLPVVECLKITADVESNALFQEDVRRAATQVETGVPISKALEPSPRFPVLLKQMLSVGEETGESEKIMTKLASFYEEEIDNMTKNLTSIIEPVLLLVIGVAVGFMVIAIILPIQSIQPS